MLGNWQPDRIVDLKGLVAAGPVSRFPGGGTAQTQSSLTFRATRLVDLADASAVEHGATFGQN